MLLPASDKLLVIDDDATFCKIIAAAGKSRGFDSRCYGSLVDMGSFARIKEFDIAIIDYYLGSMHGDEIAEYVDTFFRNVPVLIVSARNFDKDQVAKWPDSVRRFVSKSSGADNIIASAREVLDRSRLLQRLSNRGTTQVSAG